MNLLLHLSYQLNPIIFSQLQKSFPNTEFSSFTTLRLNIYRKTLKILIMIFIEFSIRSV